MTIGVERMLNHMAWANQQIFGKIKQLPDEALTCFVTDPDWTVGRILQHIVQAGGSFVIRLNGAELEPFEKIVSTKEIDLYLAKLADFDLRILQESLLPDAITEQKMGGKVYKFMRSTMVWQAVHHATEHRAQLVSALEVGGFKGIKLDDYDLWHFEASASN